MRSFVDRRYWEERNREPFVRLAAMPPEPGQAAVRANFKLGKIGLSLRCEAVPAFDKATRLKPNLAEAWNNRGAAL